MQKFPCIRQKMSGSGVAALSFRQRIYWVAFFLCVFLFFSATVVWGYNDDDSSIIRGIYDIYDGDLLAQASSLVSQVWQAVYQLVNDGGLLNNALSLFGGFACSLIILYFFTDMLSQASKDMFSLERFIVQLLKFFIACAVLICTPTIVTQIIKLGSSFVDFFSGSAEDGGGTVIEQLFSSTTSQDYITACLTTISDHAGAIHDGFTGPVDAIAHLADYAIIIISGFITWLVKVVAYFLSIGVAVQVLLRTIFMPVGVVQMFEEGSRSAGVRYFKKYAVEVLTMGVMLLSAAIVQVLSNALTVGTLSNVNPVSLTTADAVAQSLLSWDTILTVMVPRIALVGAMGGSAKVLNDVLGV